MSDIGTVIPVSIREEVANSYIDYAMSVIVGRALPDVRDGLKPVHRRILYTMYEQGNTFNRAYKKSARIVGDVMGKFHPHGDQAIYDALVRMAQDFNMRLLLVDGQGNFGSVDGDPPAAMRYTEVRMARAANDLLADIDKETVDFGPNYDDSELEPLVLPTRVPNLLVNGSEGIAVGMATKVPPHNLGEVIDATIHLIHNPQASVEHLMAFVKGPDFPTGGIIYGTSAIREAYTTGRGIVYVRARADIEVNERSGRQSIVIHELPYQVNKARLLEKIAELVRDKKIEGISDIRDESDRRGMRAVIELKREAIGEIVLNQLFKMTQLQSSFGIIMLALVAGRPEVLNLRDVLKHFIDFRRDVVTRRTRYELRQALAREHILFGLTIALDHLDAVIALIRKSQSPDEARAGLMTSFGLSERQATAILDMRLQRLTGLERAKIIQELAEVQAEIQRLRGILGDETVLMELIVAELQAVREAHADARRTEIVGGDHEISLEDLIADEDMAVTVTHQGYIKRTPITEYRAQRRGGRGRTGMSTKDDDIVEHLFVASNHTTLLVFTTLGRVYRLKVHELPSGGPTTRGRPIVNLLELEGEEKAACILPVADLEAEGDIVMVTESGTIKRTSLSSYARILSRGIIAIRLREGDHLTHAALCRETDRIFLVSRNGQSIQFPAGDVSQTGRDTMGVRGMRLASGDAVVAMEVVADAEATILTVTRNGYGKRTMVAEYPLQGRGGKGVITIKTSQRNGRVVAARLVAPHQEIVMITNTGRLIRMPLDGIPVISRATQGVRMMRLEQGEWVAGVALLEEREEDGVPVEGEGEPPVVVLAEEPEDETEDDELDEEEEEEADDDDEEEPS